MKDVVSEIPVLETARLQVRPFVMEDLADAHRLFDVELDDMDLTDDSGATLVERERWLQWTVLNFAHLARLHQPPYGDRAIILKATGQLIGSVGFVPCLMPFEQLPYFAGDAPLRNRRAPPRSSGCSGPSRRHISSKDSPRNRPRR